MIYDLQTLQLKYKNYRNISQKIKSVIDNKLLVRVKRGLYTDDINNDLPIIANICYGPSYLSYEYALSLYGLIPEHVSVLTSTCFNKKNNKKYNVDDYLLDYRSVPDEVFNYGIVYKTNDNGINYKIASKEKALCDLLYLKKPVRNFSDLKIMLFEDLRIDEIEFMTLDYDFIQNIAPKYHSNTLLTLSKYLKKVKNDDSTRTNN